MPNEKGSPAGKVAFVTGATDVIRRAAGVRVVVPDKLL